MSILGRMYEGGGARPVSWPNRGDTVEGTIVGIREKQCEVYGKKGVLETWDDGTVKMTPIVTVQTDQRLDAEDDGRRDVYLRSHAYTAFAEALRAAFPHTPNDEEVKGSYVKLMFASTAPSSGGGEPRKLFKCRIVRSSTASAVWEEGAQAEQNGHPAPAEPAPRPAPPQAPPATQPAGEWHSNEDIPF